MFLDNVVDFIITIFTFWAFGKHSVATDITKSLSDNQVPKAGLVMLLSRFSTMVVHGRSPLPTQDVQGKLAFQVLLVLAIHLWMFFILSTVTKRLFSRNVVAQLWYFVTGISLTLSAYHISCGYPTCILSNFLTEKYNHLNLFLFQGFSLVLFLAKLQAMMDWVWMDTTLSLSSWMCGEYIYTNVFSITCGRETEKKYPQPKRRRNKNRQVQHGRSHHPVPCGHHLVTAALHFSGALCGQHCQPAHRCHLHSQAEWLQTPVHHEHPAAIHCALHTPGLMRSCPGSSSAGLSLRKWSQHRQRMALWRISPQSQAQMKPRYNGTADITLCFTWNFQRDLAESSTMEYTNEKHTLDTVPKSTIRWQLASLLEGTLDQSVVIPTLFPKYIPAPKGPKANPVKQLQPMRRPTTLMCTSSC